jgi:hypothetical protein
MIELDAARMHALRKALTTSDLKFCNYFLDKITEIVGDSVITESQFNMALDAAMDDLAYREYKTLINQAMDHVK